MSYIIDDIPDYCVHQEKIMTCWLIEFGDHPSGLISYFGGGYNPHKGVRFCRYEDAERVAKLLDMSGYRLIEHAFDV